tara:strand:+ start:672 stop:935 length:264 start_codon:yes stop_codon:yes gene_type:complete
MKQQPRKIEVGDLVYHLLYGKSWLAVVIDLYDITEKCFENNKFCREYVMVHMYPGSEYENFFLNATPSIKLTEYSGLVSYHWLRHIA